MTLSCDKDDEPNINNHGSSSTSTSMSTTSYYKLITADPSQVCDGETLMQFDSDESMNEEKIGRGRGQILKHEKWRKTLSLLLGYFTKRKLRKGARDGTRKCS
mmetsp:Transcript_16951/g.35844  ORF Transcript_16951/g.35844 Transcript_16951/m.35844 type:complete len:103 (+) Transcript_16951:62-370(+)